MADVEGDESNLTTQFLKGKDLYYEADKELQDHILAVYGTSENRNATLRPTLADAVRIGFFSLDHASQTDVTEMIDLKEMTEVIQDLLQEVGSLRRDINLTKQAMQADHDSKLQAKSLELYCRINEKVLDLEKVHQDRVNCLRKAYRQQLADAIARLSVYFNKNLQVKMVREQRKQKSDLASKEQKFREMQATILQNEGVIQLLKAQLKQYQMNQQYDDDNYANDRFMDRRFSMEQGSPRVDSVLQEQLTTVQEELDEVTQKLEKSEKKVTSLEEALKKKEEEVNLLYRERDSLKEQQERNDIIVEQLKREQSDMADVAAQDKEATKRLLGHQQEEMKHLLDEQVKRAAEETVNKVRQEAQKAAMESENKIKQMASQISSLEKQLAKNMYATTNQVFVGSKMVAGSDEKLKAEIKQLQGELEKAHQVWEKKFAILQHSMYALKDESYLRQTLQRQAAQLHRAAVSYSSDLPSGLGPGKGYNHRKKPLPNIQRFRKGQEQDRDYISYTLSAPSGRGTGSFFADENQIMAENEADMMPADMEPLPSPVVRAPYDFGNENHSATQPQLVQAK